MTLSCAGYEYCFSLNNREKQIRTAHRCALKVATAYLPPPPCGTRKELRAARLLDFFDRYGCSASLHPPLAALGSAPPAPFPDAGGLYQQSLHKNAPAAPYKRRRVGRNLRLSRADPALCSGQPSPLRCILLSPQGLTTLRGPRLYGAYRRVGSLGRSPK